MPAARQADRRAGDRECRDRVAVAAEDGRREGGQADLELVDGGRVAARANGSQIVGVAVLGGRGAPGEEDLAVRRQVVRDALPDPVRGADEVPAVALGELVDAERRRHAEVHRLAGLFRQRVEMLVREIDQRDVGLRPLREAEQDGPGPHRAAVAVALEEALSLERGEEPGRGALRQLGGLGELADSERSRALDHAHEQLRRPVDRLSSGHNHIMEHQFHLFRKSVDSERIRQHVREPDAALRDPLRGRRRDARRRLAADRLRARDRVHSCRRRRTQFAQAGQDVDGDPRQARPGLRARAGREGAARVRRAGAQPRALDPHRRRLTWLSPRSTGRRSCARATSGANASMDDFENFCRLSQAFPQLDSAGGTICEPDDTPLDSRHLDMVYALQTLTDKPYMGSVTSGPNAVDTIAMGEILFGEPRGDRGDAGLDLADQRQLAAALRRPHARGDARVRARRAAGRDHAVPADGRDVAGLDPCGADPADGRGAGRDRAGAADPAGHAGDLRLVPLEHRHAVGLAQLRHARVGRRPALHGPDRAPLRPALAERRRPHRPARPRTHRPRTRR